MRYQRPVHAWRGIKRASDKMPLWTAMPIFLLCGNQSAVGCASKIRTLWCAFPTGTETLRTRGSAQHLADLPFGKEHWIGDAGQEPAEANFGPSTAASEGSAYPDCRGDGHEHAERSRCGSRSRSGRATWLSSDRTRWRIIREVKSTAALYVRPHLSQQFRLDSPTISQYKVLLCESISVALKNVSHGTYSR